MPYLPHGAAMDVAQAAGNSRTDRASVDLRDVRRLASKFITPSKSPPDGDQASPWRTAKTAAVRESTSEPVSTLRAAVVGLRTACPRGSGRARAPDSRTRWPGSP